MFFFFSVSAFNIVYQRNGDGEAKSPACRAGVCEAVLHTVKQGTRFSSQVVTQSDVVDTKYVGVCNTLFNCHYYAK